MPLFPPVSRQLLHNRIVQCWGYQREDGLWDIEGRLIDTKTYAFPNEDRGGAIKPGEPLHDLRIRLTIDNQFVIRAVEACTDSSPFSLCPAITERYQRLVGARIGPGWSLNLKELFQGINGCTHMTELLGPVATTLFQTLYGKRYDEEDLKAPDERAPPPVLNTCHALASDSPIVRKRWPQAYTGSDKDTMATQRLTDSIT